MDVVVVDGLGVVSNSDCGVIVAVPLLPMASSQLTLLVVVVRNVVVFGGVVMLLWTK